MSRRRAYKEIRLQQLRSFCETARLGSLAAAAQSLGVAQPTVWEQVHALEKEFKAQLVETHGRGCRLTDAGRLVAELAGPLVASADTLKQRFNDAQSSIESHLTVAAPQRILVEDLPEMIARFEEKHPNVRLHLVERRTGQVLDAVESREADLGITTDPPPSSESAWLEFQPAYELDIILVAPADHPLAKRRRIGPGDLSGFPLVNSRDGFPDPSIAVQLDKLGAFNVQPRRVEAVNTPVIRRYVEMGFGVGIVVGLPRRSRTTQLFEHNLSRHFGRAPVYLVARKGALLSPHAVEFSRMVKTLTTRQTNSRGKSK